MQRGESWQAVCKSRLAMYGKMLAAILTGSALWAQVAAPPPNSTQQNVATNQGNNPMPVFRIEVVSRNIQAVN